MIIFVFFLAAIIIMALRVQKLENRMDALEEAYNASLEGKGKPIHTMNQGKAFEVTPISVKLKEIYHEYKTGKKD